MCSIRCCPRPLRRRVAVRAAAAKAGQPRRGACGSRPGSPEVQGHVSAKRVLKSLGLLTTWDVEETELSRACRQLGANQAVYKKRMLQQMHSSR